MTPCQSRPYARHIAVIPAAKLCDSIAIVFLSIEKNTTPSPPMPRSAAPFCLLSKYPYLQISKDFDMRHNKNYVEYNGISIKPHQFVTNCPYQTIYSNHNICSYVFCYDFTRVWLVDCAIKSGPRGCGKLTQNLFLH